MAASHARGRTPAMGAVIADDYKRAFYTAGADGDRANYEDAALLGARAGEHCQPRLRRRRDDADAPMYGGGRGPAPHDDIEAAPINPDDPAPMLENLASDVTPADDDDTSNDEELVLSLPTIEGWLSKVGTFVKLHVPVFVRCRHGVLTVHRDVDEKPKQRLVLQGAQLQASPEDHTIHIQTSHGKCGLQCDSESEHSVWYDAIRRSVEWEFAGLYEQGRDLAQGASARVYVAKRRRTGGLLAMKSVDKLNSTSSRHEVSILQDASHPNVMRALDILETDEHLHIAQPLMAHGSLRDELMRRGGSMTEDEARRVMWGILNGLTYIHDLGVVHRDLKPDNVFLHDHQVKVGDFGLSSYVEDLRNRPPAMCGTPHFAAPEMVRGEHVDEAVDVWAAGVTLFELLTGKLPFVGDTFEGLFAKIKLAQFDVKALMYRGTSVAARTLVMQMLTPARDKRISVRTALGHEWFDPLRQ